MTLRRHYNSLPSVCSAVVLYGGIVVKKEFKELQNYKKEQQE
jgi:hypothetical protein